MTFPPHATLGVHSHPCDTLYVIQSGEFIVDGEGVLPARASCAGCGPASPTGPSGPDPTAPSVLIVSTNGPFGVRWGHGAD